MTTRTIETFDLVVVGTGAAASAPISKCRAAGWRVAVVDDQPYGGTCSNRGCDPKKVLVGAASLIDWHRRMTGSGLDGNTTIDWPALMRFKRTFTDPVPARTEEKFADAGIFTFHGAARFTAVDQIAITDSEGETRAVKATHFLIASGATPVPLKIPGENDVCTSTDFLELDELPARIAFIGAGYISLEFAHLVQRAGSHATVFGRDVALAHFDQDLVERLVSHSKNLGIDIRTEADVTAIEKCGDGYRMHVATDSGTSTIDADLVVHGAGRIPGTKALDLESGHVGVDKRGAITVNEFMQSTTNPSVYVAGDCALPPGSLPLTPVASHEGFIVASNLLHGNKKQPDYRGIPSVVFTEPPLAMVGLTEADARRQSRKIRVKCEDTSSWFSSRHVRETASMFKTIVDEETGHILGTHLLGPHAAEVINIFALAIRNDLTVTDLKHMIYSYPTSSSDVSHML